MPTVCIDCRYIGPRPSGIAEAVQGLVDFVPELAPDLDFLLLKHPSRTAPLTRADNVREVVVTQPANGPATMWWLPQVIDLSNVDLFHATFNIMPAGLKIPCVTTLHDIMWLTAPRWCNPTLYGRIEQLFYTHGIGRALRHASAIASVSDASRREIIAHGPQTADRTFVTRSGVASDFHPVARDPAMLAALGLRPSQRFVLVVGQYAPYKNHDGAMRGFASAFYGRDDIDLVFVQRMGAHSQRLRSLADELGIGGRVHLLGPVERTEMVQLYSSAAALLHPSLCEGFGNPLAEAMACGCPVVTSNVSAMPEVTAGAANLACPRDPAAIGVALREAVDDPARASAMRRDGIARAAQMSWRAFAQANLDIYRRVLGSA